MMTTEPHDMMVLGEQDMEEALGTIAENIATETESVYHIYLPHINWVKIILENVTTIGEKLIDPDNINENLVQIEFIIEGTDYDEPDYE